jgi:6-methylsalicylate decarboxylase
VSTSGAIDVHAHFLPETYRTALLQNGHGQPDGFPRIPAWSVDEHLGAMDRIGIATSLLSISSPGVHLGAEAATRDLTREVNEEGSRIVMENRGRFGLFASLPLPDVDAAVAEIAYCCDRLDVAGFAVLTNVGGSYLGDTAFAPVFRELDRRHARLFIHPTSPPCWEHTSFGRPRPMLEFFFDTTRAVVDLLLNGTVARHPGIEFLIPHAGATLPMVADRVNVFSQLLQIGPPVDVLRDLGRLHFDLAGFALPRQLTALLTVTSVDHLHYGSDYPFTPEVAVSMLREGLSEAGVPPGTLLDTLRSNSERLFPALFTDPRRAS